MRCLLKIILFIFTWYIISGILGNYYAEHGKNRHISAKNNIPSQFNVLVVSKFNGSYKINDIHYSRLNQYIKSVPNYSYLIPIGKDNELNQQLINQSKSLSKERADHIAIVHFNVKRLPNGKQSIILISKDGIERSHYIADSDSIEPLSFTVYVGIAEGYYVFGAIIGMVINIVLWFIVWVILKYWKSYSKNKQIERKTTISS